MSERLPLSMPVRRVTAFEDRAELVRRAEITLAQGRSTLVVEAVTPLSSDAHVSAWFEGSTARVEEIRVDRRWVEATPDGDRMAALVAELDQAARALKAAERVLERTTQRREASEDLLRRYLEQVGPAVWSGDDGHQGWREALSRLEDTTEVAQQALEAARVERREKQAARERVAALLQDAERHEARLVCDLTVRVFATDAGAAELVVTSVVPCALWRPAHEAHLLKDGSVRWTTYATVWQRTGEAWNDVELVLSTDRPGAGASLPEIGEDRLRLRDKAVKKRVVLEHREEAVSRDRGDAALPGVYDGGEARVFRAEGGVDVPSDGRPHRVSTGAFETEATAGLVAMPEVAAQVFLRARLNNRGQQPVLAGPVTLLRDGAYVGVGEVKYVGPGEAFELSFGSDDRFGVEHERTREEEKRMVGRDRTHFVTHARIDSSASSRERVEVVLRLPVSELEALDVRMSEKHCTEGRPEPDDDGLVRLEADLAPGERQKLSLGFHLDKSGDIVLPDPW